ncbi:DUF2332 domain-containing protein [Aquihabitans daechungensis]|uniref:DUF2332 domain-containing protein n=1 Tax=Aquihabitans daechungensis TaxID=1052257 RepID=UPI003B9F3D95
MTTPDPASRALDPSAAVSDAAGIAQRFRAFAEQAVPRLPLYRRLCEGAADDLDVCARLLLAEPDQRTPNLLLAAVHEVLLAGALEPLGGWYPSIPGPNPSPHARSRPVGRGEDDPWPHFRRLALEHATVAEHLRTRSTQTNEVGRSATLFPGLFQATSAASSAPPGALRPIGIVEIGASAGLNLNPGAYGYRYTMSGRSAAPGRVHTVVGDESRLMLDCELRGEAVPPLPEGALPVASAVGLDLHPVDVADPDDARWLEACQWPEELARLSQLRAAIALSHLRPPQVVRGDAVDDVARLVQQVPSEALPVVVSTWVLSYLPVARQQALMQVMDDLGADRDVAMVLSEQPERVPGVPVPPRPDGQPDGRSTALVRLEWRDGQRTVVRLADQHPHGRWLEWLGP